MGKHDAGQHTRQPRIGAGDRHLGNGNPQTRARSRKHRGVAVGAQHNAAAQVQAFHQRQIAALPVVGLPDQPQVNAELLILPRSGRTPERIRAVAGTMRQMLEQASGLDVAVRVGMLDPETYLALK